MAGIEAIAPGTTQASYEFDNTTAAPRTIALIPADGKELVPGMYIRVLRKKYSSSHTYEVFRLTAENPTFLCLGNFRVKLDRPVQDIACGADVQYD